MRKKMAFYLLYALLLIIPLKASANNLLSRLEVEGIGELSIASKNVWNLQLTTSLGSANIIATPASEGITITGAGNVNVTPGNNQIVVTATNGTETETYTINLNVIQSSGGGAVNPKDGTPIANPDTGKLFTTEAIITILLTITILVLLTFNKRKIYKVK